jgi:alpha-N-arabinofuranosidase
MTTMKNLKSSILAASLAAAFAVTAAAAEVGVTLDPAHPGPVISKYVYGQFAEHLGTGIYGGLWVGPDSAIPNTRGWRNDVVGALKALHVPLVRWPGGCFADQYHWRDGIGPRARRPVRINTNWGGVDEDNAVGTDEFFDLVGQLGADAYVNGNLGSGTAREMSEWMEYMTAAGNSSLARLRARNGHPAPYKVAFFGIGNEAWGCGGNMRPEQYADAYRRFATFVHPGAGNDTRFIAAGGHDDDTSWTDYLSQHVYGWGVRADGISFHYYTSPGADKNGKYGATGFDESRWIQTLSQTERMEAFIANNVAKLDAHDPRKKLMFAVDEWGTWYDAEEGSKPGFLQQQNTLRDALVAALNFNIFHAHADRVRMTSIAQMVNVLQAMIRTDGGRMVLTPTYHVFKMYVPFQDAVSVPLKLANNPPYTFGGVTIPAVSASAARGKDGKLYLALVNTNPRETADVDVGGTGATAASGTVLTAAAMDAHNTFAAPHAVAPAPFAARAAHGRLVLHLPAKSVAVVALRE